MNSQEPFKTETRTIHGHDVTLSWFHDPFHSPPWKEHDGHGIISDWESRPKAPGERILCSDRTSHCFYDWQATMALAKKDGWGLGPIELAKLESKLGRKPTQNEIVAESVERDFQYCKGWANDDWHWCGYQVEIDGEVFDSLWGIESRESEMDYHGKEAWKEVSEHLAREQSEAFSAACRDIAAV